MVKDRAAGAVSRCDLAVIAKFLDHCPTKREPREQAASAIAVHPLVQRPARCWWRRVCSHHPTRRQDMKGVAGANKATDQNLHFPALV
jgi:hypothetical protein